MLVWAVLTFFGPNGGKKEEEHNLPLLDLSASPQVKIFNLLPTFRLTSLVTDGALLVPLGLMVGTPGRDDDPVAAVLEGVVVALRVVCAVLVGGGGVAGAGVDQGLDRRLHGGVVLGVNVAALLRGTRRQ